MKEAETTFPRERAWKVRPKQVPQALRLPPLDEVNRGS
jgi:hypothetical protein